MNRYNDITIHQKLSASTQEQRVLLSCGGQYYEASHAIVELVEELQRHETEEEAIAQHKYCIKGEKETCEVCDGEGEVEYEPDYDYYDED